MKNIFPSLRYNFLIITINRDLTVNTLHEKPLNRDTEKSQKVHSFGQPGQL